MDLTRPVSGVVRSVLLTLLVLGLAGKATAGDVQGNPATTPEPVFAQFLQAFRGALAADDRAALASLTELPFLYEGAGLDAAGFRRVLPEVFPPAVRRCVSEARPIAEDDRYVIFCTPYAFYFGRVAGEFRLLEFMADGEALEE